MYIFSVGGDKYKIRYSYGVLYKSDLMDRVINVSADQNDMATLVKNLIGLTAEMLLEGLQKYHSDKFGYVSDEEREQRIREVCSLIDDYEDEHTDENGERDADGFTLFNDLQGELERNGFLSRVTAVAQETAAEQDATMIPQDHKKKARGGQSK